MQLWADLYLNGLAVAEAEVEPYHLNQDLQGTNTLVLRLKAGDLLWVGVRHGQEGVNCERAAIFTGVYLRN